MSSPDPGRSQYQRMLAGELYVADDPEIERLHLRGQDLLAEYNATTVHEPQRRRALLESLLAAFGEGSAIRPPLHLDYGAHLHIGARVFANNGLTALDVARIEIGDDVQIGPNVALLTPTHPVDPELRRAKWESAEPITLGDNVWLGGGVTVCPGVTIGANTVVGAGAVVVHDLPPDVVAVGNPARIVRRLPTGDDARS